MVLAAGFDPETIDGIYTANDPTPDVQSHRRLPDGTQPQAHGNVGIKQTWPALRSLVRWRG